MKTIHPLFAWGLAAVLLGVRTPAAAGAGHDHGDAGQQNTGAALPRFAAVSETFELVGVLNGKQLTLYLDRYADNTPVRGAQIELEWAGTKFKAEPQSDDSYEVVFKDTPQPGVWAITATVSADQEVDLLVGELDLHEPAHTEVPVNPRSWKRVAGWAAAGLLAAVVLVFAARRLVSRRPVRAGGVA